MSYLRAGGRSANDVIRLILAGGKLRLDASGYTLDDLIRFAVTAGSRSTMLNLHGLDRFDFNELVRIVMAGRGSVCLEL